MNALNDRLRKLFDHVTEEVAASGGDGVGTVVFRWTNIQEVAKAFEEWKAASPWPRWLPHRKDYAPGHVLFSDESNEGITFVSAEIGKNWHATYSGHDEIWLEVY